MMLKRIIGRFKTRVRDWHLRAIPNAMPVKSVCVVSVMLMADTGERRLAQMDWDLTIEDFPALKKANRLLLAIRVWENGDTATNLCALAHLLPDIEQFPLPDIHASRLENRRESPLQSK